MSTKLLNKKQCLPLPSNNLPEILDLNTYACNGSEYIVYIKLKNNVKKLKFAVGDILVVDRNLKPEQNNIVLFETDKGYKVQQYDLRHNLRIVNSVKSPRVAGVVIGVFRKFL